MSTILQSDIQCKIQELLKSGKHEEVATVFVEEFTKDSVENCRTLLNLILTISDKAIRLMSKEVSIKSQAIFMLLLESSMDVKRNEFTYFASMVPVCMAHFPEGNAKGYSEAEQNYFSLFCKLLRDKKAFSWSEDRDWADIYGYTEYLKLVESQLP